MKPSLRLIFLFFTVVAAQPEALREYYLSEHDFLSGRRVPESQVSGRAHLRITLNRSGDILSREWLDPAGTVQRRLHYEYPPGSHQLRSLQEFDAAGNLKKTTTFGEEETSRKFLEYLYGATFSPAWDDRFMEATYTDRKEVAAYDFHAADAQPYGGIRFAYDSTDRMISQTWQTFPDGKIIRKWLYIYDASTRVTRTLEYAAEGRLVSDIRRRDDGAEDVMRFLSPADSTVINSLWVSYRLHTDLSAGVMTWVWMGGAEDVRGQHPCTLYGLERKRGDHRVDLGPASVLVDSAWYRLEFTGVSARGHPAVGHNLEHIFIDRTNPELLLGVNRNGLQPRIVFSTSEPLRSADIIWESVGDTLTAGQTLVVPLTGMELTWADHPGFIPEKQPQLRDETRYNLWMRGCDRAGNWTRTKPIEGILIDVTPPRLFVHHPLPDSYVSTLESVYSSNEALSAATMIIFRRQTPEKADTLLIQQFPVENSAQDSGGYQHLIPEIALTHGEVYDLGFTVADANSNQSDTITVRNVGIDTEPPLITSIYPYNDSWINSATVSYIFSEQMSSAEYRWVPSAAVNATLESRVFRLEGDLLSPVKHINIHLDQERELVDGAVYMVTLTGRDLAGNPGDPFIIRNVGLDTTRPRFEVLFLVDSSAVNTGRVSYRLSETLQQGWLTWVSAGGKGGRIPDSPAMLVDQELQAGSHREVLLKNRPELIDGESYRLEFGGTDRAGNMVRSGIIEQVRFDTTVPRIQILEPQPGAVLSSLDVVYQLDEDLLEGELILLQGTRIVRIVNLDPGQRRFGKHTLLIPPEPDLEIGRPYRLVLSGRDRAGNSSGPITVSDMIWTP